MSKKIEFGAEAGNSFPKFYAPIFEAIENGATINESWTPPKKNWGVYDLVQEELCKAKIYKEAGFDKLKISGINLFRAMGS
jgi:hypothetical protein